MPDEPSYPYIPSTEASKRFDLTNDYIGSLCRRGKVRSSLVGRLWYVDEGSLSQYLRQSAEERLERRKLLSRHVRHAWALGVLLLCVVVPGRADASVFGYIDTGLRQYGNTIPAVGISYNTAAVAQAAPEPSSAAPRPVASVAAYTLAALPDAMIDTTSSWLADAGNSLADSYIAAGAYVARTRVPAQNSAAAVQAAPAQPSVALLTLLELPRSSYETFSGWIVATGESNADAYIATGAYLADAFAYFDPQPAAVAESGSSDVPPAAFFTLVEFPDALADTSTGWIVYAGDHLADLYMSAGAQIDARMRHASE